MALTHGVALSRDPVLVLLGCVVSLYAYEQLPDLPRVDAADFLPVIRTQIERAEAEARAQPRDAKSVGALAMTLHAYQKYDAAAPVYQRAHLLDPENFDWLYLLGAVETERGNFEAAAKSFQSALALRSTELAVRLRLAQSLAALANWDEAAPLYRRILDEHGDLPQAWYGLGRVQAGKGDHAGAAQSFAKACEFFPAYGAAHFALAGELRRLGNKEEAKQHLAAYSKNVTAEPPLDDPLFRRIHELNQSAQVRLQRGAELEKLGQFAEAAAEHEAALAADPVNVQAHVNLISLYARTGNYAKAKQHFESAIQLNPGRSDAWYNNGVLLVRERNYTEAEQAFRRALEINPYYAEAHNNLGSILERQGRLDDAAKEFREAVTNKPDYPLARFHLGRLLVHRGQYDEAIQQFLKALTPEDEQTTTYLYALAATYARAGDRQQALVYFQKALDAAVAHGQSRLLGSIERDLKALRNKP